MTVKAMYLLYTKLCILFPVQRRGGRVERSSPAEATLSSHCGYTAGKQASARAAAGEPRAPSRSGGPPERAGAHHVKVPAADVASLQLVKAGLADPPRRAVHSGLCYSGTRIQRKTTTMKPDMCP